MNHTITLVVGKTVLGGGLALGFLTAPHAPAHAAPIGVDVYAYEAGDDDGNGRIDEDESGWDCATMGNRICGPGNSKGVPAGRYDEGGVLIDPWTVDLIG